MKADLANNFMPTSGQTFNLITFGSKTSDFSSIESPLFGIDLEFHPLWSSMSFSLATAKTAYGNWKIQKFGAHADNMEISGPLADANQNGVPNLLEYAFGMEPLGPDDRSKMPQVTKVVTANSSYLAIQFRRLTRTPADLQYRVLETADLASWLPVDQNACQIGQPVDNGDGTETVTIRGTLPITGEQSQPKGFLRVEVIH